MNSERNWSLFVSVNRKSLCRLKSVSENRGPRRTPEPQVPKVLVAGKLNVLGSHHWMYAAPGVFTFCFRYRGAALQFGRSLANGPPAPLVPDGSWKPMVGVTALPVCQVTIPPTSQLP